MSYIVIYINYKHINAVNILVNVGQKIPPKGTNRCQENKK